MLFHEIYGCYYRAVAQMLNLAIEGELTEKKMYEIVAETAFEESSLIMIPALKEQEWQLLDENLHTPLKHTPDMPLTILEKRWLKTILLDKRVKLFLEPVLENTEQSASAGANAEQSASAGANAEQAVFVVANAERTVLAGTNIDFTTACPRKLADTEPLFFPEDIVYFDRYVDGDDYDDPAYIANFRLIRQAIAERRKLKVTFRNGREQKRCEILEPVQLEYSDKEDKFRVLCADRQSIKTVNLGRIVQCELLEDTFPENVRLKEREKKVLKFILTDERNALERAMMKFSHYKKEVERRDAENYLVTLEYDADDETDVLIQILSFGSYIEVTAPDEMREELRKRMERQMALIDEFATFFP